MTLFRSMGRRRPNRLERILADFEAEVTTERLRQAREEMLPPRPPDCRPPAPGPGWASAWASNGQLSAAYDPCGRPHPPLKAGSDEKGSAP